MLLPDFKLQFTIQSADSVILSERSESKDLRTKSLQKVSIMRRFFDFALRASLRMTFSVVRSTVQQTEI